MSAAIGEQELSGHVKYLAQPSMRGRARGTAEGREAAAYVERRFQDYGLRPWGTAQSFELPSAVGVNVAGVLPGSDCALSGQIVLVVAHFDHLGVVKGKICPGAADNASGVAAMLEMAEQFSLQEPKPRRSICFLATDGEEAGLLGAFAFIQRQDFDPTHIAAIVNIDGLGRKCFDSYRDAMLVFGTEKLPQTRRRIADAAATQGMRILPIGMDVLGLRADHAAFEPLELPTLFFTCGPYGDYHKPADVPNRLNYAKLRRETLTIAETIRWLADSQTLESPQAPTSGDREELAAILEVMHLVQQYGALSGVPGKIREALKQLITRGKQLVASESYTSSQRLDYFDDLAASLPFGVMNTPRALMRPQIEACAQAVKHYLQHAADSDDVFPTFKTTRFGTEDSLIDCEPNSDGSYRLRFSLTGLSVLLYSPKPGQPAPSLGEKISADLTTWQLQLVSAKMFKWEMDATPIQERSLHLIAEGRTSTMELRGDPDDLVDFCLDMWALGIDNDSFGRCWDQILRRITNAQSQSLEDWIDWHQSRFGRETGSQDGANHDMAGQGR